MDTVLAALLPTVIPHAISWAERQACEILRAGLSLNERELSIAAQVGVTHPARVRILFVDAIPKPDDMVLRTAVERSGLFGPNIAGMMLGHGIFIRNGCLTERLASHELRHVFQYEQAGSIASFLRAYLAQIVQYGYQDAPYEKDAREHEV